MSVVSSLEDFGGFRCVDVLRHPDGTFFFKEYRRDPEDGGRWTLIGDYSSRRYASEEEALTGAAASLGWFAEVMRARRAAAAEGSARTTPED
jgi:hypothetical protein